MDEKRKQQLLALEDIGFLDDIVFDPSGLKITGLEPFKDDERIVAVVLEDGTRIVPRRHDELVVLDAYCPNGLVFEAPSTLGDGVIYITFDGKVVFRPVYNDGNIGRLVEMAREKGLTV